MGLAAGVGGLGGAAGDVAGPGLGGYEGEVGEVLFGDVVVGVVEEEVDALGVDDAVAVPALVEHAVVDGEDVEVS